MANNGGLMAQLQIEPAEIKLIKPIGSGSFGAVYMGTCLGQTVAIKTMLMASEDSMLLFRAEITLTASLRHVIIPCPVHRPSLHHTAPKYSQTSLTSSAHAGSKSLFA